MSIRIKETAQDPVDQYFNQFPSVSYLTRSEELKSHFYDSVDDLKSKGLNDEEAFEVASLRLIKNFHFEKEFEKVYFEKNQTRSILLILTGIIGYFLIYFSMLLGGQLLFLGLKNNPGNLFQSLLIFVTVFHLIFAIIMIYCYMKCDKITSLIHEIKPKHLIIPAVLMITLSIAEFDLNYFIRIKFSSILLPSHYISIFDYSRYSFSVIAIVSSWMIIEKYLKLTSWESLRRRILLIREDDALNEEIRDKFKSKVKDLQEKGLRENEAISVIRIRENITPMINTNNKITNSTLEFLATGFSGILIYILFYYFTNVS